MIKITSIGDKASKADERIGFRVSTGCDLKNFIVYGATATESGFTNRSNQVFWFYPTNVEAGDRVVLYTGSGTDSIQKNDDGSTTYFRYWGLEYPIFTSSDKIVVLINAKNWTLSSNV